MTNSREDLRAWLTNSAARDQVMALLDSSGVPLEARVAKLCGRLKDDMQSEDGIIVQSESLLYGSSGTQQPLRELDHMFTFHDEFTLGDYTGIQLILRLLVEAKHRRGAQVFGVRIDDSTVPVGALPTVSTACRSSLVRKNVPRHLPDYMREDTLRRLAILLFKDDGITPWKASDEDLIYKAAGAVYDFIRTSATEVAREDSESDHTTELLLGHFEQYLEKTNYPPWSVARQWLRSLPRSHALEFQAQMTPKDPLYQGIEIFCPVVCIDAPLYSVELDHEGRASRFGEREILVTSVRPSGWPSAFGSAMVKTPPEAITSVCTLAGLETIVSDARELFKSVRASLRTTNPDDLEWMLLEQSFLNAVWKRFDAPGVYRSDLHLAIDM